MGCGEVLTLVVKTAEMLENSLVTIGSNENAIALQNAIGNHFKTKADAYKAEHHLEAMDACKQNNCVHCDSCKQDDCEGIDPSTIPE